MNRRTSWAVRSVVAPVVEVLVLLLVLLPCQLAVVEKVVQLELVPVRMP